MGGVNMTGYIQVDKEEYDNLFDICERLDGCLNRAKNGPPCINPEYDEDMMKILTYVKTGVPQS